MDNDSFGPGLAGTSVDPIIDDSVGSPAYNYYSWLIPEAVIALVADKTVLVDFQNIPFLKN